jgi:carbonic anhydrase
MNQSPIKLKSSSALPMASPNDLLSIEYPANGCYMGKFDEEGNLVLGADAPFVKFRGRLFQLVKVHIHMQSEHIVEGEQPGDYEIHFVHVPSGGTKDDPKVVIGIIYRESESAKSRNGFVEFARSLPSRNALTDRNAAVALTEHKITPTHFFPLLPESESPDFKNWFHYEGSLTGFPFSEDVSWFVMNAEALVNPDDTEKLEQYAEHHARDLQPLNRRLVVKSFA